MSTVPDDFDGQGDAELIALVRSGTLAAYGTLYERHVAAAYNLARQLARSKTESDDLVSEAFAKVLDILRAGKGPDSAFRAYLLTTLRHTAYDKSRRDKRVDLNEDMTTVGGAAAADALTVPFADTAIAGLERTMAAKAFARLPERWQAVLWHTEIEQQTPAEVAPLVGLTANGVSALAYRAREGLRQAYLQVHLAETSAERCRATADRLGAWTRQGLSKRERAQVEAHLDECDACRALAAELADVNGALRAVVAPIVLGGAALGYLSATGGKAGAAAGAAVSAGGAAGAASAGPRQFIGVALSGLAITAAVAAALALGGGQSIPRAGGQAPTEDLPSPAVPPSVPLAPSLPAPSAPPLESAPPPVELPGPGELPSLVPLPVPPATTPPASTPAAPVTPPPSSSSPPPSPSSPPPSLPPSSPPVSPPLTTQPPPPAKPPLLVVTGLPAAIELDVDGLSVELSITIRNDGGTVSEPVSVMLNLPTGLRAVGSDARSACLAGESVVTCGTGQRLQPGESTVFSVRLVAGLGAKGGLLTGTVTAGSLRVPISLPVLVHEVADLLGLAVETVRESAERAWLKIDVRNDGPSARPVTVRVGGPAAPGEEPGTCETSASEATCAGAGTLAPKEHLRLAVPLSRRPGDPPVTVTAMLGSATTSISVAFDPGITQAKTSEPAKPAPPR
ncbi:MAG TPA: sigma-70 family RNA polymerase sigma factor [Amycolatopsis sp.]|nr:sigma-70 family RNA polymerase sigma factor [Amycolatopsis sp.]